MRAPAGYVRFLLSGAEVIAAESHADAVRRALAQDPLYHYAERHPRRRVGMASRTGSLLDGPRESPRFGPVGAAPLGGPAPALLGPEHFKECGQIPCVAGVLVLDCVF